MVRSTSTAIRHAIGIEPSYGVLATSMQTMRGVISDSMQAQREYAESDERTPDLLSPARSQTYIKGGGGIELEESSGSNDELKQLVMNSAGWSSAVVGSFAAGSSVDFAFASGDNKITASGTGSVNWNVAITGLVDGAWIKISNAVNAANNGYWRVEQGSATKILVVTGLAQMVTESLSGATITADMLSQVTTGVANNSATIERKYSDLTSEFTRDLGCIVTGFEKSITAKGKVTCTATIESKSEQSATSEVAVPTAAPTGAFYSVNQHFKGCIVGFKTEAKTKIISASCKVEHADFAFDEAGVQGPSEYGKARFTVSGTLEVYYEGVDATYTALESGTRVPIAFIMDDGAGGADIEDFPNCLLTAGPRMKKGGDVGTTVSYTWVADRHDAMGIMARFARVRA